MARYIELLEGEVLALGGNIVIVKNNLRSSAVRSGEPSELKVGYTEVYYIGDEEVEKIKSAEVEKEVRRRELADHWKELEKTAVRFGHPLRRGRKWLRRNNVDIVETHTPAEGAETKASNEDNEKATENATEIADEAVVAVAQESDAKKFVDVLD